MIVVVQILKIAFWVSLSVWLAVRVKRHPEKDERMRKEMAKQRGAEYEAGMQKFLMVNYLTIGLVFATKVLLEIIFGMDEVEAISMWIIGCVLPLVYVITKWCFIGELSKFEKVFFSVWLAVWFVVGFIEYYICV